MLWSTNLLAEVSDGVPGQDTPKKLVEAWLRFYEEDLFLGIDASFAFDGNGMEVQGIIEDDSSYQKFEGTLQPLRGFFKIGQHLDRPQEEKKPEEKKEKDPPPSLWENYELRSFLGDPMARAMERVGFEDDVHLHVPPSDDMLKQRLLIYAEQVLGWNKRIERYAKHLPALTRFAQDQAFPPDLRVRASALVMAHSQNMEKLISRLNNNLSPAFPRSEKRDRAAQPEKSVGASKDIADYAEHVRDYANSVSKRVYQFIHPEHYTVGLDELRRPSLLESLKTLQKMTADFQKAFAKIHRRASAEVKAARADCTMSRPSNPIKMRA